MISHHKNEVANMTIGDRIKQRRLELVLSQEEVAIKAGYKSRSSVNKLESSRNLPLSKVEKMAIALECTPSYLMGWEDGESLVRDFEHSAKLKVYENLGYDAYFLVEVHSCIEDTKKKELVNFAKYLLSTSKTKREIMSSEEIKQYMFDCYLGNYDFDKFITEHDELFDDEVPLLNAAHERTDIEATDEMKEHDEAFFDEED